MSEGSFDKEDAEVLETYYMDMTDPSARISLEALKEGTLTLDNVQYQNKMVLNSGTVNGSGNLQVGHKGDGVWTVKGGTSTIYNNFVKVAIEKANDMAFIDYLSGKNKLHTIERAE